jgi:hypothetical protein
MRFPLYNGVESTARCQCMPYAAALRLWMHAPPVDRSPASVRCHGPASDGQRLRRSRARSDGRGARKQCPGASPGVGALPAGARKTGAAQWRRRRDVLVATALSGWSTWLGRQIRLTRLRGVAIDLLQRRARVCAATVAARRSDKAEDNGKGKEARSVIGFEVLLRSSYDHTY